MNTDAPVSFVVNHYIEFLSVSYLGHVKPFRDRLSSQPASARAEAIVYSFLKAHSDKVYVAEDRVKGGVDFSCSTGGIKYVVEVTHLDAGAVEAASGLPNEVPRRTGEGRFYGMITPLLRKAASNKAKQMSGYCCPTVLVIASEHVHAGSVMDTHAACHLLTDEPKIAIPRTASITTLDESVFFRKNKKYAELESCRQSISAILLANIGFDSTSFIGLLHPDPIHKFTPVLLPSVPFVGLKKFPPEHGILHTVWYQQKPHGFGERYYYPNCLWRLYTR